ncbi:Hypothetical_protein [Hexamita inflata]|uniref:Hypothetical_protein n=1 Tax=Hexamita inflata TaxID=28002 RepID=A0AA86P3M2_9EUKA|nr:Hypothetical protein HINF_LOCUS17484 [Hexamita inflata]
MLLRKHVTYYIYVITCIHIHKIHNILYTTLVLRYNGTVQEKSMNMLTTFLPEITDSFLSKHCCLAVARANEEAKLHYTGLITMLCMEAPSRRSKVRETVKLPEEWHRERRQASRVWEQGKKAKPKATLDRTGQLKTWNMNEQENNSGFFLYYV